MVCERREASACLIMLSAKQGSHWYHFYNVFGMTRPGIDPTPILTYRTRSGRSTTWAIAAGTSQQNTFKELLYGCIFTFDDVNVMMRSNRLTETLGLDWDLCLIVQPWNWFTINFRNIRTPKTFVVITLKIELCGSTIEYWVQTIQTE